jgi:predicted kinase
MGNIGTGKTNYRNITYLNGEIIVCPDDWHMSKEQLHKKLFSDIENGLSENKTVVVDGINMKRKDRDQLLYFAKRAKCPAILIDFGPGNDDSLKRRINNSLDTSAEEWTFYHLENLKNYEKPLPEEGFDEIIPRY